MQILNIDHIDYQKGETKRTDKFMIHLSVQFLATDNVQRSRAENHSAADR